MNVLVQVFLPSLLTKMPASVKARSVSGLFGSTLRPKYVSTSSGNDIQVTPPSVLFNSLEQTAIYSRSGWPATDTMLMPEREALRSARISHVRPKSLLAQNDLRLSMPHSLPGIASSSAIKDLKLASSGIQFSPPSPDRNA